MFGLALICLSCGGFPLASRQDIFNVSSWRVVCILIYGFTTARRVLYILGKWAIIEAAAADEKMWSQQQQQLLSLIAGKRINYPMGRRRSPEVQFVDALRDDEGTRPSIKREMKTFNQKTEACNLRARQKLSFADGEIGWLPQPPLLFSLVGVMWCVCGDGRGILYKMCMHK